MAAMITFTCLAQSSSLSILSVTPKLYSSKTLLLPHRAHGCFSPCQSSRALKFKTADTVPAEKRGLSLICSYNAGDESDTKGSGLDWANSEAVGRALEVADCVPDLTCMRIEDFSIRLFRIFSQGNKSFGLIEAAALPYLGLQLGELSLDEKAEILFVDQSITTAAVLAVMYSLTNYQPLPDDFFRYDWREAFNLQKGWLLRAGIGLLGALASIALTGAVVSLFRGENPQREPESLLFGFANLYQTDALVLLLPLIGSSSTSTACLVGITGVLAPLLEETVFRGFFMVSLTKWLPTPLSVLVSAAVFAVAHLTPGEFPQLFVLGTALGFSYAHTRNLLTPITIHAIWNSGVILFLTFLQLQGYDIKELLQSS